MFNALKKKLSNKLFPSLGETVVVDSDFLVKPMQFYCASPVEQFRTVRMGDEPDFLREFVSAIRVDDVVFDIGSNIGLFGIAAAFAASAGKVFSIDPDPAIIDRLCMNIRLNRLTNHVALQYAISDKRGELVLFTSGVHGFSPSLRQQNRNGAPTDSITVPCISGDQLVAERIAPSPTVVKIDVEGAEYDVLLGMRQVFSNINKPRAIFIELHPNFLPGFGKSLEDCDRLIHAYGYESKFRWERDAEIQCLFQPSGGT